MELRWRGVSVGVLVGVQVVTESEVGESRRSQERHCRAGQPKPERETGRKDRNRDMTTLQELADYLNYRRPPGRPVHLLERLREILQRPEKHLE